MSERTFLRRFLLEAGTTPKTWLQQERVRVAQRMLESSAASLDQVATDSGFASHEYRCRMASRPMLAFIALATNSC